LGQTTGLLTDDDGLFNPLSTVDAFEVPGFFDGLEERVRDEGVVLQLVNKQPQGGTGYR
jgi:hypothetical protein